jgi:hypothetical protein
MIVDKHMDLNIYKERKEDGGSSCCEPSESKTDVTPPTSSCCAPATSCCSAIEPVETEKEKSINRVGLIDFNEWVSKCHY